jgi:hypothetical protein
MTNSGLRGRRKRKIVLTMAEMNKLSRWSVNDSTRLPGRQRNRSVMQMQFMTNRQRLRKKKASPMPVSHCDLYGTAG